MAINFLNTLQFNNNQALNFRLQVVGTDPTTDLVEGRLVLLSTASEDTVKVYVVDSGGNGSWQEVGSGSVTSVGATIDGDSISISGSPVTTSGDIDFEFQGTSSQYIDGAGNLTTFPSIPTVPSNIVETFTNSNGTYISASTENNQADGDVSVGTIDLSAQDGSGSASTSLRFLSKDNEWIVPAYTTNVNTTYDLSKAANSDDLILKADGTAQDTITFEGEANTVKVDNSVADKYTFTLQDDVEIDNNLTVGNDLSVSNTLSVTSTGSFGDQVTIPLTPSASTDAASKGYVDGLVSGGLTFKGTFRADSGLILSGTNNGSYIYNCPGGAGTRVAVAVGDYYVVANTGGSFYCTGDTLDIGDSIIGVTARAANQSLVTDWSIVQSDEGVVSFTNSNGGTYVAYGTVNTNATGAVTIGDVDLTAVDGTSDTSTKFLSKDNTWDVPSYTTNT
ncbi:MAG: hypothetical protein HRU31_17725, partial [Rhodobacteraceae bacterium]|nr:hypothetical protein [Paracoccaceae bacterium]